MQSTMIKGSPERPTDNASELSIVAHGSASLTVAELAAMRKEPLSTLPAGLSPQFLRHSEDQTLAALAALSKAMRQLSAPRLDFSDWAIACTSDHLGRKAFASVIEKYGVDGPWGVSVQVIPHCTAHAVAGTASLALQSHGPCIGVGSGRSGDCESLLWIASMLRGEDCSGAWVLLSGWSAEPMHNTGAGPRELSKCLAAAIALEPHPSPRSVGWIRVHYRPLSFELPVNEPAQVSLLESLTSDRARHISWCSPPLSAARIELDLVAAKEPCPC